MAEIFEHRAGPGKRFARVIDTDNRRRRHLGARGDFQCSHIVEQAVFAFRPLKLERDGVALVKSKPEDGAVLTLATRVHGSYPCIGPEPAQQGLR